MGLCVHGEREPEAGVGMCVRGDRYEGTDSAVMTPLVAESRAPQAVGAAEIPAFETSFVASYKREFGFVLTGRKVLVDDLRVRAVGRNVSGMGAATADASSGGRTSHTLA